MPGLGTVNVLKCLGFLIGTAVTAMLLLLNRGGRLLSYDKEKSLMV